MRRTNRKSILSFTTLPAVSTEEPARPRGRFDMIPGIKKGALSLALIVGLGFAFVPQGCGGVQPAADMPEGIAGPIRGCAVEHERHLGDVDHTIAFDVKLDSDGRVDTIALVKSDIGDEELETCMAAAIRSLTEDDLMLRRSESFDRALAQPQSRDLLGNPAVPVAACLASPPCLLALTVLVGASAITVQLWVHATMVKPKATTTSPPISVPRKYPNQTCEDAERERLDDEMHEICDKGFATICGGGGIAKSKLPKIPCSVVRLSLQQRRACLQRDGWFRTSALVASQTPSTRTR